MENYKNENYSSRTCGSEGHVTNWVPNEGYYHFVSFRFQKLQSFSAARTCNYV